MTWRLSFDAYGPSPRDRRAWQNIIALYAQRELLEADLEASPGPVAIKAQFFLAPPKGLKKATSRPHIKEPDPWTLASSVRDGLKGITYRSSAVVTDPTVIKRYTDLPGHSHVRIEMWEVA